MISIYLDWNVIVQMKNNFHPELKAILESKRFFIPYSTSHIGDVLSGFSGEPGQRELVDTDLDLLSQVTENNCLSNDGKEIKVNYFVPRDLFDERLNEKDLFRNFSLDTIEQMFDGDETIKALGKQYIDLIRNIPLDKVFADALKNPESAKYLDTMFPGLKDNPTMEGFFKSFGEMITRMNENDDYKELRKITQGGLGINRDQIFNSNDPYAIIEKTYEKLNFDTQQDIQQDKHGPAWFNEISNEYLKLDMHGYQEDKVDTAKGRKETFRNTTEDAFHAGFASTCNFYILNDNRAWGYHAGIFSRVRLSEKFSFVPELQFIQKGYEYRVTDFILSNGAKYKINYLGLPVMVAYSPVKLLSLELGPTVGFKLGKTRIVSGSAGYSVDYPHESVDFGFTGGLRFDLSEKFSVSARYYHGLSSIFDSFYDDGTGVFNRNIQCSLYYILR